MIQPPKFHRVGSSHPFLGRILIALAIPALSAACTQPVTVINDQISGTVQFGSSIASSSLGLGNSGSEQTNLNPLSREVLDIIPGRLIVRFKPDLNRQSLGLNGLSPNNVRGLEVQFKQQSLSLEPVRELANGDRLLEVRNLNPMQTLELVANLQARNDVLFAEPDRRVHAFAPAANAAVPPAPTLESPNDPLFPSQWWLGNSGGGINAIGAWTQTTGSPNSVIAVIDSGVALEHPDLKGKLLPGYDFISDPVVAADGDGRDANPDDPGDEERSFHGTHVAGIAAAASNNAEGLAGISWGSALLPVRILGVGGGSVSDLIDAILWSAGLPVAGVPLNQHPVTVINLSLGGSGGCSNAEQDAIHRAIWAGISVVVAAGNENLDTWTSSPANCDGVISVGAVEAGGARASYSNFGAKLNVMAPGGTLAQGITSSLRTGSSNTTTGFGYGSKAGTSMAAPMVSATVALMKSANPALTPAQLSKLLEQSSKPLPSSACSDLGSDACGAGLIDAGSAVLAGLSLSQSPTPDFALELASSVASSSATTITLANFNGFTGQVTLSLNAGSSRLTGTFSNSTLAGGTLTGGQPSSVTLALNASNANAGEYTVQVAGSSPIGPGGASVTRIAKLFVRVASSVNPGDPTPSPNPAPPEVPSWGQVTVTAFYMLNASEFDSSLTKQVKVSTSSASANSSFTLAGLVDGAYRLVAWRDVNQNRKVDAGDWLGSSRSVNSRGTLRPPASGVGLVLERVTGIASDKMSLFDRWVR